MPLFLHHLLRQAAEAANQEVQDLHRSRFDLQDPEWCVLYHLGMNGRMAAQDISDRAMLHKTRISRSVQRLERRQLVRRGSDERDRRREPLELTEQGRAIYETLLLAAHDQEASMTKGIARRDLDSLRRVLVLLAERGREAVRS